MDKRINLITAIALGCAAAMTAGGNDAPIVATDAYRWQGDTLYQNEYKAWAVDDYHLQSTYKARPGFFMPIEQSWSRKNDLSTYPRLAGGNMLHRAVYNMSLDEMVNAVEPDTTLRTGKEWAGVWTRDVSYSIILSMAALQPEASMISLMKKVNSSGQIIQDTGSGGAWPISTDRIIWVVAAYEIYKVTGDKSWIEKVYPIGRRSIAKDDLTIRSERGLVKGETSFIDWREQSHPRWMQTADIAHSEAMGTNVLYAAALKAMSEMATILGKKQEAADYSAKAAELSATIDATFYMPDKGYYGMYTYGRDHRILNPRAETLGEALAILYDIAPADRQREISQHNPITPFGPAIFYPQIADMPSYHNNALWPFVGAFWTLAQAKVGNEPGVAEGFGAIVRPAALFCTNKENFNLDNGDIYTELNSSNMLWCLSGNIALTQRILFGINFEKDGLRIAPFVPKSFEAERELQNFPYRGARLDISVKGYGDKVKSLRLNGKELDPTKVIAAKALAKGGKIEVEMCSEPIAAMSINRQPNLKAPLTPIAWLEHDATIQEGPALNLLKWNPIEYIGGYIVMCDGKEVARTRQTQYAATTPGEWQVIGVADDGTQGFASEPRSNRPAIIADMDGESTAVVSKEVSYQPKGKVEGYYGRGFAEISRDSEAAKAMVEIAEEGEYAIRVRYANGNGPVNTENKACIRALMVDEQKCGTVVMPQRGVANWNDWGYSNSVTTHLSAGKKAISLRYLPEDENMNIDTNHALIDRIEVVRIR